MRRKFTFLVTLWWLILCGTVGVCLLLFANPDSVVSNEENRTLAGMPDITWSTLQAGGYSEAFESFLTDKFFLRSELVDGTTALKHMFSSLTVDELLNEEGEEVFVPALVLEEDQQETSGDNTTEFTSPIIATEEPETVADSTASAAITGDSANVWLLNNDGSKTALLTYSLDEIQKTAETLNAYAALLPVGGKLHVLFAPRSQTANKFALHLDTAIGWSSEVEPLLSSMVSDNVEVYSAYDIFQTPILSGEYVYFRTDHHWTALGAYLAADAMLKSDGYQTIPLSDYSEKTIDDFLGSIYLHGRSAKLKELADTITAYYPLLPAKSYRVSNAYKKDSLPIIDDTQTTYLVFLGGTYGPYRVLEGGYQTGKNMLLICDSFGNSIAPFFMPYYDDVYMVDLRDEYYTRQDAQGSVKDYIRRCDIDDLYIVLSDTNNIGSVYLNKLMPENID